MLLNSFLQDQKHIMPPIYVLEDHTEGLERPIGIFSPSSSYSCGGSISTNDRLDPLFLSSENMDHDNHDEVPLPAEKMLYISPPSTGSHPTVALPAGEPSLGYIWGASTSCKPDQFIDPLFSFPSTACFGGLLDSPLVMHHTALKPQAPLSPPPTQPTSTLALPPADTFHDVTYAASTSSSCLSPILPQSEADNPLLSPLSPEWESNSIAHMPSTESPEASYLLRDTPSSPGSPSSSPPLDYHCDFAGPSSCRPFLPLLDIRDAPDPYPMPTSDHWDDSSLEYTRGREAGDPSSGCKEHNSWSTPSPLSTPSTSPSTPPPILDEIDGDLVFREPPDSWIPYLSPPNSPSIPYLPSLDDEDMKLSSPSSPSMRSFTLLPTDDDAMLVSPGLPVLALPGADTDDDLLSEELGPSRNAFVPDTFFVPATLSPTSRSLLLLDDPNDVPPPRSPSPENFNLDPTILAEHPDPDLQKLHDLRKKAQMAERAARQREMTIIEEDGFVPAASEARRAARREKERGREVAALLRLKLNGSGANVGSSSSPGVDEARSPPSPTPAAPHSSPQRRTKKPKMTSISQLVAKMIFSRREPRPAARIRPREHASFRSPLSKPVDDDEHELTEGAWAALRSPSWGLDGQGDDMDLLPAL